MEVRTGTLSFPRARDIGPRTEQAAFNFPNPVLQAVAGLTGTNFGFSPRDDHHLGQVNVRLSTSTNNDVVIVEGTFGVRDWTDNFDDDYEGSIQFVVLAELELGSVASNLTITDVEYNQTIQFFRSRLDPATANHDTRNNSIGLIAGKNTILRVYVDTQTDPTRPTIASISGSLEVRLPGSATPISIPPLNGPILPKRDSAIRRSNVNDTLNFFIPGSFSVGDVDIRVRVFDATHPNQPGFTSGPFEDTLQFTAVESLSVRGVGIHYTGRGGPIPPPIRADLISTLNPFVRKNYPVGSIFISGFDVIDFAEDFTNMSGGGCGQGWRELLRTLRRMQGDSNDVYYGLVPIGVPLANVIGCGGGSGRVAAGTVGDGPTAAQEIGHAFGRKHAPCSNAGGIDPSYPLYDALPPGSIGEFGIDDLGAVQDPAFIVDFMGSGCSSPAWVSPYTYEGLRQHFPPVPASPGGQSLVVQGQGQRSVEQLPIATQHLFLDFTVYRGGKVEIFPSFHYRSLPTINPGSQTPYGIELRDEHDKVLQARRVLLTDPHGDLDSASLDFFEPIPFSEDTTRVVFTCSTNDGCEQKELLTVDVPRNPPEVSIVSPKGGHELSGKVRVAWTAHFDDKPLYYLLRYSNNGGQSWRNIVANLKVTEYTVDLDRLPGGEKCQFQVLATEGIRTGMAVSQPFSVPHKRRETTIIEPPPLTVVAPGQTVPFLGEAFSPDTGSADPSELQWYSNLDGLLGIGQQIYIRTLHQGIHTISLRAPDGFGGESVASIQIEVKAPIPITHTSLTQPNHTSRDHQVS